MPRWKNLISSMSCLMTRQVHGGQINRVRIQHTTKLSKTLATGRIPGGFQSKKSASEFHSMVMALVQNMGKVCRTGTSLQNSRDQIKRMNLYRTAAAPYIITACQP